MIFTPQNGGAFPPGGTPQAYQPASEPTPPAAPDAPARPVVDEIAATVWILPDEDLADQKPGQSQDSPDAQQEQPVPPAQPGQLPPQERTVEPGEKDDTPPAPPQTPASPLAQAVAASNSASISAFSRPVPPAEFPVGWLVCLKGEARGKSYQCRSGRNRIGRGRSMEISIPEEGSLTRDTHSIIIYEPRKRQFFIQAGTSDGLTYHNGEMVFTHEELRPYDRIVLGQAEFLFLPLCGDAFTWDDAQGV